MNDFLGSFIQDRTQPMVDFNYNDQNVNRPKKSMFQMFTPKNSKNSLNNNPKDLFNANNKINSILSKKLKSIYKESKNDLSNDNPLFDNVNSLIKKSKDSNKFLYNKFLNISNNNNQRLSPIKNKFQKTAIIRPKSQLKGNTIIRKSIKKLLI